ncbi:hypothetical protein ACE1AT_11055 [Pelatocladus sp. BLCC-F211]|uniref:hypothetical protein n=1 Tax=Pelatocladus sp. BLCC-F211 TaxID=3342752 RepID=UPI0035B7DAE8
MSASLQIIDGGNKRKRRSSEKAITRPHCKVSIDDVNWVRQQPPCVQQLWLDCIAAEQYGGAAHKLETNLSRNSFIKASAAINAAGLFEFEEVRSKTQSGRSGITGFRVKNLHGYFNRNYWENFDNQPLTPESQAVISQNQHLMPDNHQMTSKCQNLTFSEAQSVMQQEFQNPNYGVNNPLTTYQQPTKVVGTVVGSDAQNENLQVSQTAIAPLGGASPPDIQSASEQEEESPVVTDCTSLTLVDGTQSQSASSPDKNQVTSEEAKSPHEDISSAPPPEPNFEKWSDEAIAARSKARPVRMEKLKLAQSSGQNPGFEYLKECWDDDPALQIVIKKLLAKFPGWGIAIVDGVLVATLLAASGENVTMEAQYT